MTETFEVGQRVRVSGAADGEIIYGPFPSTYGTFTGYVVRIGGTERLQRERDLSAIPEPPKFAIGDKVTVSASQPDGSIVAGPFKNRWNAGETLWVVEGTDGLHSMPAERLLTKVVEPEPASVKVGDRVRVIAASYADETHGEVGTALEVDSREEFDDIRHPFYVDLGDGTTVYASAVARMGDEDTYTHNGVTYDLSAKYRDRDGDVWRFQRMSDGAVHGRWTAGPIEVHHSTLAEVADECGPLTRV